MSARPIEKVVIKQAKETYRDNETIETHPCFGTAVFNHRNGSVGKLYGSNLSDHSSTISLVIAQSKRRHGLGKDWIFSDNRLVEVEFSAAQFAELLTTMNCHSGVPCTIRYVTQEGIGEVPGLPSDDMVESERVVDSFKRELSDRIAKFEQYEQEIAQLLEKPTINKADRKHIAQLVYQARRFLEDNAPFLVDQFNVSVGKLATSAKSEIDAFMTNAIHQVGLKALNQLAEASEQENCLLNDAENP